MLHIKRTLVAAAVGVGLSSVSAHALSIDLSGFSPGLIGNSTIDTTYAKIISDDDIFVRPQMEGTICAARRSPFTCAIDMTIQFKSAVDGLKFVADGFQSGPTGSDATKINIFGSSGLLAVFDVIGNGLIDLSAYSGITSLRFDDSSLRGGIGYGEFNFELSSSPSPVPVPASLPLLLGGLGMMGYLKRRVGRK